jgi:hypothetical protein
MKKSIFKEGQVVRCIKSYGNDPNHMNYLVKNSLYRIAEVQQGFYPDCDGFGYSVIPLTSDKADTFLLVDLRIFI